MKASEAPLWARHGHLQTVLGHVLRYTPEPRGGKAVAIELADGDVLSAKVYEGISDTIVALFHGLGGSTASSYIRRTAKNAIQAGHSVIMVNHRGCGEGRELMSRKLYHSGSAEDIGAAIDFARERLGRGKKVIAVGFSLSANAILLLLGSLKTGLPDAAISVNPPIDLESAAKSLCRGVNRIYDRVFLRQCVSDVRARQRKGWMRKIPGLSQARTLYEFDALVTAPEGGFGTRENYYRTCSAGQFLSKIEIPTRILTAQDDPFVDYRSFLEAKLSPAVQLQVAESGGHLGYLAQGHFRPKFWMDVTVSEWIEELREKLREEL